MQERSAEEQARLDRVVEGISSHRLLSEMNAVVGVKRTAQLLGWALVWGLSGAPSVQELVQKLEAEGMPRSSAYRAASDYRRISDHLLTLPEGSRELRSTGFFDLMRKLAISLAA